MELKLAGEVMNSRNKAKSDASRFFFAKQLFFVTLVFAATTFLAVTKSFFVTGTIVLIPIPCAGLLLEAGLICLLGGTEGGCPNADAEWGLVL